MTDILFVSESEISSELKLAQAEINHRSYSLSQEVKFSRAVEILKHSSINIVLINANSKKMEAYDLAREIKDSFRGAIKTFVYLPNSSPNEGSRFGLVNAEVEDETSIQSIVNKLAPKKSRDYVLEENITSFYSLNGGVGSSFITILLAYVLGQNSHESLVLESSNNFAIKHNLGIQARLALLSRDRSKEINQARDFDWFSGFIAKPALIPLMSYLNLFGTIKERSQYSDQLVGFGVGLAEKLEAIAAQDLGLDNVTEQRSKLMNIANSLRLLNKEFDGDSFSLFDEILQLGSKISKNMLFDLSSDISSPLNKQLLRFSKNLVVVFRDTQSMKQEFQEHQLVLEQYQVDIVPVIAPGYYHYTKYAKLKEADWLEILGEVPLIYPYSPELVTNFLFEGNDIAKSEPLYRFAKQLLQRLGIKLDSRLARSRSGFLNLLVGSHA
ncbi:MAG: hypothetical protein HOA17_02675 [Candidatus Melainabacteria bacterium]|jgi:hypothetical protein|nr:hypothetical protein [Candidatus Melainabacteria bacterium]